MPTLMSGLQIALRSLMTHSQAVEITEHNVANASTVGYHRQAPVMTAAQPDMVYGVDHGPRSGLSGTGVAMQGIQRFSTAFYDTRYRASVSAWQQASAESEGLSEMEALLSEVSEQGMPAELDTFWNNWQSLAADPTNMSLRSQLLEEAQSLTLAFHDRALALTQFRQDVDDRLTGNVQEINDAAAQLASLNAQIARYQSINEQPNDFMDARDRLLDRLSEMTGAVSYLQPDGQAMVSIGGHVLVSASSAVSLQVQPDPLNPSLSQVTWEDGTAFSPPGGEMRGLLNVRDTDIPQQLAGLDQLAAGLAAGVNAIHRQGYGLNDVTGMDFFTGSDALSLTVNPALDAASLATAQAAGQPGDGGIADQIALLRDAKTMQGGMETFNDFAVTQATVLGQQVKSLSSNASQQELIKEALEQQRQSLSGVSLDEEAANLVRYQKAYQAAARLVTTYDEMLNQVINQMGLVGRS